MRLECITADEMTVFLPHLEEDYARQMSENMDIPLEAARERSHNQIAELLPQGEMTPGHLIYVIRQEESSGAAGYLWVFTDLAKRSAFVYDIEIMEALRGRGLARAALLRLEELLLDMGIGKVELHVFGSNPVAQHLYQSLGYEVYSMNMRKQLRGSAAGDSKKSV